MGRHASIVHFYFFFLGAHNSADLFGGQENGSKEQC